MNSPSHFPSDDDRVSIQLDEALAVLRREHPDQPLRRDAVLERVVSAHARSTPATGARSTLLGGGASRRWAAAAAIVVVAGGAAISARLFDRAGDGAAPVVASGDPLMVNAASVIRALATAHSASRAVAGQRVGARSTPDSLTRFLSKSLADRSALLLAATRAAAEQAPVATERARLLRDVEYVLAQVVQGAAQDDVERELTLDVIRSRRLLDRMDDGALQ